MRSNHPRLPTLAAIAIAFAIAACGHRPAPPPAPPRPALAQLSPIRSIGVAERSSTRVIAATPRRARTAGAADAIAHVLRIGQPGFARCFRAAQRSDPHLIAARLAVRLKVDARGAVADASADGDDRALGDCVARGLRRLRLPRALAPAVLEVPIVFAAPTAG